MAESSDNAAQEDQLTKPYTDDVYAATPSSGSGGGEEDDDDKADNDKVEQMESISNYLQTTDENKEEKVSEWVTQACSYSADNSMDVDEVCDSANTLENINQDEQQDYNAEETSEMKVKQEQPEIEENLNMNTTFKIFVSNLPPALPNSELRELFEKHGEVVECEIFAKNYAFVHMTTEEAGIKAMEELNGLELRGCRINVKRSVHTGYPAKKVKHKAQSEPESEPEQEIQAGTYKIYVGNLPEEVTKDYISKLLEPFGRIVEIEIYGRKENSAFVHMETEEGGKKAIAELNGQTLPECEKALLVSEAKNPEGPSLPTIKLQVKNVPSSLSAEELRDLFTPYGLVLKVVISKTVNHPNTSSSRTALVHLEQFGNIRSAIKDLNGKEVSGSNIVVEAYFNKPENVKPKPKVQQPAKFKHNPFNRPAPRPLLVKREREPFGRAGAEFPATPSPYPEWTPVNRMRLIPMPSEADFHRNSRPGRGRRPLRQGGPPPPPLMSHHPFPTHSPWEINSGYNNEFGRNEFDGFGGGYSNYEETEDYNSYDVYDWSQYQQEGGNNYAPPLKIPRNNSWNNSQKAGKPPQNKSNKKKQNFNNDNNNGFNHKGKKSLFPEIPSTDEFPKVPKSLMSIQVPKLEDQDWSADPSVTDFPKFSTNHDFTSDEPLTNSLNAVPFDYSQMKKKSAFSANWQQPRSTESFGNLQGKGNKNKSGKGRKGKPRRPGLGSAQQRQKTAHQIGNDGVESSSTQHGEWQPPSSNFGTETASVSSSAPSYFQQNWSFSKGKQKHKKPTAKQIKEAEEEQRKQYSDYLKQKPWLYQAIPGIVKKVQK